MHVCSLTRCFFCFTVFLVWFVFLQVNLGRLFQSLLDSPAALKSPEIIPLLLTCPFLKQSTWHGELSGGFRMALVIKDLSEKCLKQLSRHLEEKIVPVFLFVWKSEGGTTLLVKGVLNQESVRCNLCLCFLGMLSL